MRNTQLGGRSPAVNSQFDAGLSSSNKQVVANNNHHQSTSKIPITKLGAGASTSNRRNSGEPGNCDLNIDQDDKSIKLNNNDNKQERVNRNCQVCIIQEVREDLMKINKIVQERNEQITKLKARCLRSYFERQMLD